MARVKLGDIAVFINGDRGKNYPSQEEIFDTGEYLFVNAGHLQNNFLNCEKMNYISAEKYEGLNSGKFQKNDILYCLRGSLGKKALIQDSLKGAIASSLVIIRVNQEISISDYVLYALDSSTIQSQIFKSNNGSYQPNLSAASVRLFEFELPALAEQVKIVEKLNAIKSIITHRRIQLEKLDELIKARFVEMFGEPEFNNYNWDTFKMAELCTVSSSKRVYQSELTNEGVPFLRISDLVNRMDYNTESCDLFISEEKYSDLLDNGLVPQKDDILVTARGTLGRCYIVKDNDRFYFQDGMITWLSGYSEKIIPVYISYLFSMQGIKKQIEKMQAGSTVAYLSIAMTKKLNIMLPPIELQNQFANFVKQIDNSKAAVQKSLDETQMLFDSLMQEYFG